MSRTDKRCFARWIAVIGAVLLAVSRPSPLWTPSGLHMGMIWKTYWRRAATAHGSSLRSQRTMPSMA